jgi:uncharacterized membrane protein (Fun14 family)
MKIAAVIVGLFVAGLAYLSYRGWIDVKWTAMENATRSAFTDITIQAIHTLNDTASHLSVLNFSVYLSRLEFKMTDGVPNILEEMNVYPRKYHL